MANDTVTLMDNIINLCKRRGFVFQSSEIYGGFNGFFDYGPLGVELKNNIKQAWWKDMVHRRDDIAGLDSTIIHHPTTWKASGHIDNFTDPLVDCKESKMRYRADQLFFAPVVVAGETIGYVSVLEDDTMQTRAQEMANDLKRKLAKQGELAPLVLKDLTEATPDQIPLIPSPATGKPGSLTPPRSFNMMFQTYVGALQDASAIAYLRPETAQGIFINFKNVVDTGRFKIPFGIAQIGKAFRNEINPRNFIFRSREFEQMEIEYFISPEADWQKMHADWIDYCMDWFAAIGIPAEKLSLYQHPKEKLSHYSKGTTDIMFEFPFGVQELQGIAARGNFDLTQHGQVSGKPFDYFDESTKSKYTPHVIEPSVGVDRIFLAVLTTAYAEEEVEGEKRVVLKLHPRLAPYKAAVFPLVKNKPELLARAEQLYKRLKRRWNVFFDASGAIGRRYRRQDEIGTPYGITVDFDTLEKDGTVTLRDRDTLQQVRMTEDDLIKFLEEKIEG
ncbi:MAG: glycine--tRNA ligase [Puniceicoccales bacterium]|nr:glycine--tRNA ligase [Puniceicoccales bacterium]